MTANTLECLLNHNMANIKTRASNELQAWLQRIFFISPCQMFALWKMRAEREKDMVAGEHLLRLVVCAHRHFESPPTE